MFFAKKFLWMEGQLKKIRCAPAASLLNLTELGLPRDVQRLIVTWLDIEDIAVAFVAHGCSFRPWLHRQNTSCRCWFWWKQESTTRKKTHVEEAYQKFASICAFKGYLSLLNWAYRKYQFELGDEKRFEACDRITHVGFYAGVGGHMPVLKWFLRVAENFSEYALAIGACYGGHLDAVKWLHQLRKTRDLPDISDLGKFLLYSKLDACSEDWAFTFRSSEQADWAFRSNASIEKSCVAAPSLDEKEERHMMEFITFLYNRHTLFSCVRYQYLAICAAYKGYMLLLRFLVAHYLSDMLEVVDDLNVSLVMSARATQYDAFKVLRKHYRASNKNWRPNACLAVTEDPTMIALINRKRLKDGL